MLSAGAAVPILDRFDLLRPGGLSKWSGVLIFVAGLAALITSMVGHAITTARSRSAAARVEVGEEDAAEAREEDASVLANIQTLSKQKLAILYVALTVPQRRYEVDPGTIGDQLLKKNIFVAVGVVPRVAFVCEVHPAVLAERTRLLPGPDGRLPRVQTSFRACNSAPAAGSLYSAREDKRATRRPPLVAADRLALVSGRPSEHLRDGARPGEHTFFGGPFQRSGERPGE